MFSIALQRNTKLLKEKEEQETKYKDLQFKLQEKHKEIQCKLQNMKKQKEGFQVMFNEAFRRNAQLLKDKVQLEETQREMQHVLQDFMKKNTELPLFTKQRTKTIKLRIRNKNRGKDAQKFRVKSKQW